MAEISDPNNPQATNLPGSNLPGLDESDPLESSRTLEEEGIFLDLSLRQIIQGQGGDDTLIGSLADDTIVGNPGNDTLYGNAGSDSVQGNQGSDTIAGGPGNDFIQGNKEDDFLFGDLTRDGLPLPEGTGNDFILGGIGNDLMFGNQGDDSLDGEGGTDTIYGGKDNDFIIGDAGEDFLAGDDGNDLLYGGLDNDILVGGLGIDTLYGEDGADILNGSEGNDLVVGGAGDDILYGDDLTAESFGAGNDIVYGNEGNDIAYGGSGNDVLFGNEGNDNLFGNRGNDVLYGGQGDDTAYAGQDNDQVFGDKGNDVLFGNLGNDFVNGGEGNDLLLGNEGSDLIDGGSGGDIIYGGQDNDTIRGEDGDDLLFGDKGDDVIFGGVGSNTLTGGQGSDQFVISPGLGFLQQTRNLITDFTDGQDFLLLADGITFDDLDLRQEIDANGTVNTVVLDRLTGTVTILQNVSASAITRDDFLPPLAPPPPPPPPQAAPLPDIPTPPIVNPPVTPGPGPTEPEPEPEPEESVIQFSNATYRINENGTPEAMLVTVTRGNNTEGVISADVVLQSNPGTATAVNDYENFVPVTIRFAEGDTTAKQVAIPIVNDTLAEDTETISLQLTNLTGTAVLGSQSTATVEIIDDDNPGELEFVIPAEGSFRVKEDGSVVRQVQVRRVNGSSGEVSAQISLAAGSASTNPPGQPGNVGEDFGAVTVPVSFADGETATKTIQLPPTAILRGTLGQVDGLKIVNLSLTNPTGGVELSTTAAPLQIEDMDQLVVSLEVTPPGNEAFEAQGALQAPATREGVFTIALRDANGALVPAPAGGLTVSYRVDTTAPTEPTDPEVAVEGQDYNAVFNNAPFTLASNTVFIPEGSSTATITINPTDDSLPEGKEFIKVILNETADYNIAADKQEGEVILIDNDSPIVRISPATGRIKEGTNPQTVLTISREDSVGNAITSGALTVNYGRGGTAANGVDYDLLTGQAVIPDGQSSITVTVRALDDSNAEPDETVRITLQGSTEPTQVYELKEGQTQSVVTIEDNETPQISVVGRAADVLADPPTGNQFQFIRFGDKAIPLTVNYTPAGTAQAGIDYTALPGTISFTAGQSSVSVPLTTIDNPNDANAKVTEIQIVDGAAYDLGFAPTGNLLFLN
ncbi:Calx-beta domain-containing protein [Laspinema olomoucense]|uniref:Calx-beta domain-containing protein n=1 Tax=Laspinema olomoucense TaxID=3231600 RepID=UPI0021BB6F8C|nr:Calx-beta domain-containing protein [Laspinema sp. D3a]MCT7991572.1 hypothetical protein [Laspinema sp. D3a]